MIKKNNILIIGKGGFIGKFLIRNLDIKGWKVLGISRDELSSIAFSKNGYEIMVNKYNPKIIIYLAAIAHKSKSENLNKDSYLYKINVEIPRLIGNIVYKIKDCKLIFLSTIGVYGSYTKKEELINENSKICPENSYALTKFLAEEELKRIFIKRKKNLVILRPPLIYGNNAPGNFGKLIKLIDLGIPLPFAKINNKRSFLSINTLSNILKNIIKKENFDGGTYVIADKEHISTNELIYLIAKIRNKRVILFSVSNKILKLFIKINFFKKLYNQLFCNLAIDSSKIYRDLGFFPSKNQYYYLNTYLKK